MNASDIAALAAATRDYLRKDYNEWQGLAIPYDVTISGDGMGYYEYQDDDIIIVSRRFNEVQIKIPVIEAGQKKWNGVSILKNKRDALNVASLPHDMIADKAKKIAQANNATERAVLLWSDRVFCAIALRAGAELGENPRWLRVKLWGIRNALWLAPRSLWRAVAASCLCVALMGCSGCLSPDGGATVEDMTPAAEVNAATSTD